jgi:transcriptional regulator with XRE-family HTH domain
LADLSNLSKSYISQVKNGKRPASKTLLDALSKYAKDTRIQKAGNIDYCALFLQSRKALGVTPSTYRFYNQIITRFFTQLNPDNASESQIESFLMQFHNLGNRARYFQVIKTYYRWKETVFNIPSDLTPSLIPLAS